MVKTLIVANWKENLDREEAKEWMENFSSQKSEVRSQKIEVIICPSFPLIPFVSDFRSQISDLRIGSQDVSRFEKGPYTGEVSVAQLKSLGVEYVIVGHSERRQHFSETNKQVNQKINLCLKSHLKPIICISNLGQVEAVKDNTEGRIQKTEHRGQGAGLVVAYEPLSAISTGPMGQPDTPAHAQKMALAIKEVLGNNVLVLYGGSIDSDNVAGFLQKEDISGVLVGGASLDAVEFSKIINELH